MFCNKCGAQLADTAKFCNKCGAQLGAGNSQVKVPQKRKFPVLIIALVVLAVIIGFVAFRKPDIHQTWQDESGSLSFTFQEDGNLRISGKGNFLGADLLQFTDDKEGTLTLTLPGVGTEIVVPYELSRDMLVLEIMDKDFTLYPADKKKAVKEEGADELGTLQEVESAVEDALDVFQSLSLYGTWADSKGAITFTFNEDGSVRIGGLADAIGAELFTFTEVDNDTLQLKADSDNPLLGLLSLNLNYEISGDVMTVEIAGYSYKLIKQK